MCRSPQLASDAVCQNNYKDLLRVKDVSFAGRSYAHWGKLKSSKSQIFL